MKGDMKLNKEYEISLWEDFMDTNANGISFINEQKICVLASDTLDNPRAAYNIVFTSKTDGTHELKFDLRYHYWDQQAQDFIDNPITKHLYNEAKIKLHYKDKWFDFAIKNCVENSKEKQFSYTCQDIFIDELGRNGYSVEFSTDLGGNVGTITDLAATTLEDSDWSVDVDNCDRPLQKISEPVYAYVTTSEISCQKIRDDGSLDTERIISASSTIFICYTCAHDETLKGVDYQFYYNPDGFYETDDDGNFINLQPLCLTGQQRFQYTQNTHTFVADYRGYRYVRAQKTKWLPKIEKQASLYDFSGQPYYGYVETTYLSPKVAQNILVNSTSLNGASGWTAESSTITNDIHTTVRGGFANSEGQVILETEEKYKTNGNVLAGWYYNENQEQAMATNLTFYNCAFKNNAKVIEELVKDECWVVRITPSVTGDTITPVIDSNFFTEFTPPALVISDDKDYIYYYYKVIKSCSFEDLKSGKGPSVGFSSEAGYLLGAEMFRYYTFENEQNEMELIVPETKITSQNLIKNKYYYFTEDQYNACTDEDDLEMSFVSETKPEQENIVYYENFEKVAMIEEKESNYFNILQTLCEKFECWADFQIQHENNGATSIDENGRRIKKVVFKNYVGKENWAGFKYGINLDGIQRTIDSTEITTKIIVKANTNEFATNGSCNIANSSMNYPKTQFLLNFDYFIHQGILEDNEVSNDLYVEDRGYLGYYEKTRKLNIALNELEEKILGLDINIREAETTIQSSNVGQEDFQEDIDSINDKLKENRVVYGDTNISSITVEPFSPVGDNAIFKKKTAPEPWGYEWEYETKITFYRNADEEATTIQEKYEKLTSAPSSVLGYLNEGKTLVDNYNKFIKEKYEATIAKDEKGIEKAQLEAKRDGKAEYEDSEGVVHSFEEKEAIIPQLNELNKTFYSKYSRFLREGTWTDETYTDEDLYYLDACSVAHTSAFPKTTYSISVTDIEAAVLPENLNYDYKGYNFECGDLTVIEDIEFFGWGKNGMPYRERVLVSQTEEYLDDTKSNKITVQNYKTQFDDLFQRIAAATQSLELKQGQYDKASQVVNLNGEINPTFLQNTLLDNSLIIQNSGAQSVQWGSNGIVTTDENPLYQTRIIGGGIVISEDGGATWSTGISGKGINASMIKTGQVDTGKIRILNGNDLAFSWDSNGISGYDTDLGYYDYSKYTRHDKFGFYAVNGVVDYVPKNVNEIWYNTNIPYCLTSKGLRIGDINQVPEEYRENTVVIAGDIFTKTGQIGNWHIGDYDIQYSNPDDPSISFKAWMSARTDGKDYLHFGTGSESAGTFSGFRVDSDGKLWATGADINGSIKATGGVIGGFSIQGESLQYWENNTTGIGLYGTTSQGNIAIAVGRDWLDTGSSSTSHYSIQKAPFKVYHDGTMYAEKGSIGGWLIDKNGFSKEWDNGFSMSIGIPKNAGGSGENFISFYSPASGDTLFSLSQYGILKAKGAEIQGDITANKFIAGNDTYKMEITPTGIPSIRQVSFGDSYKIKISVVDENNFVDGDFYAPGLVQPGDAVLYFYKEDVRPVVLSRQGISIAQKEKPSSASLSDWYKGLTWETLFRYCGISISEPPLT